ncbi:MAG: CopG family transcriptional regulator [Dehalococcoidia bacterium]
MVTKHARRNIYLPPEEDAILEDLSTLWDVSRGEVVRRALRLLFQSSDRTADPMEKLIGIANVPGTSARDSDDIYRN